MPRVRHVNSNDVGEAERIVNVFMEQVRQRAARHVRTGGRILFNNSYDDLLVIRKHLWETAKSGMTKRKDLEVDIGFFSALVWWNRLSIEQKAKYGMQPEGDDEEEILAEEAEAWDKLRVK